MRAPFAAAARGWRSPAPLIVDGVDALVGERGGLADADGIARREKAAQAAGRVPPSPPNCVVAIASAVSNRLVGSRVGAGVAAEDEGRHPLLDARLGRSRSRRRSRPAPAARRPARGPPAGRRSSRGRGEHDRPLVAGAAERLGERHQHAVAEALVVAPSPPARVARRDDSSVRSLSPGIVRTTFWACPSRRRSSSRSVCSATSPPSTPREALAHELGDGVVVRRARRPVGADLGRRCARAGSRRPRTWAC